MRERPLAHATGRATRHASLSAGGPSRVAASLLIPLALLAAGCGTAARDPTGKVHVVAAENFWGSIAGQLGGSRADVRSIIVNPAQDPHSYEPLAADARTLATAQLAIVNGIGYDPWAPRLLAANPVPGRRALNVGDLVGLREGDNPHRWYDPANVETVAGAITADLVKLDPKDAGYFRARHSHFETTGLKRYHELIATIKARYGGTPVGASESIFAALSPTLGLDLITPAGFMNAISEGTEVTAQDTLAAERQITSRQIKVWIYNSQNATSQIQHLNALARAHGIPVATVTETLSPASDSFEQWQVAELARLEQALHQATGR
jgi:zinc/manganese transport system substrate-binding protein